LAKFDLKKEQVTTYKSLLSIVVDEGKITNALKLTLGYCWERTFRQPVITGQPSTPC
jgi:hypothetical protein